MVDVTDSAATLPANQLASIDRSKEVAAAFVGDLSAARVLMARASVFADEKPRDVVVILVPGGTFPFDGPPGAEAPSTARFTGIVIDAATGEFLRGFMR